MHIFIRKSVFGEERFFGEERDFCYLIRQTDKYQEIKLMVPDCFTEGSLNYNPEFPEQHDLLEPRRHSHT